MIRSHVPEWGRETDALLTDRQRLVFDTANGILSRYAFTLPVDVFRICRVLDVDLIPLSRYEEQGFTEEEMRIVWGNPDGAASHFNGRPVIGYNDRAPMHRQRFTLAEELMHVLLGHVCDPRFNAFTQEYDPAIYTRYEYEAKTAAGLILFPAFFYFRHRRSYDLHTLARACDISDACAVTCALYYDQEDRLLHSVCSQKVLRHRLPAQPTIRPPRPLDVWPEVTT